MQRLKDRRPATVDPMIRAAREEGEVWALSPSAWTIDDIPGPNVSDKMTIIALARMAQAAYVLEPDTSHWQNISEFHNSTDFGWESDGLRGHVWANDKNSTIIISMKGTTMAVFDGAETSTQDKENDNLFFSCCCGQQGQLTWRKVCDCATGTYSCNSTCVTKHLRQEHRYYTAARELYTNVTELYPEANVWVSGHSLGGAVSSLLGMTYGLPTITFESPPENLAAKRLGLPLPPPIGTDPDAPRKRGYTGTYHIGHTADPLFLGTCNGITSLCSFAGYAMETACHSGRECVYDVVGDEGRRVSLTSHSIKAVIEDVLLKYDEVPECVTTPECVDCPLWKFYESNSSAPVTSSTTTSSKIRTRTETCKTPGWWGCLDESTTSTSGVTTTSAPTTTTTKTHSCETPGWFGCNDKTTTTTTKIHTTAPVTTTSKSKHEPTSTTCATPGWWGCRDETTTTGKHHKTAEPPITEAPTFTRSDSTPPATSSSTTCTEKQWFGLICVDPSPEATVTATVTSMLSKSTPSTTASRWPDKIMSKCTKYGLFGLYCKTPDVTVSQGAVDGIVEEL